MRRRAQLPVIPSPRRGSEGPRAPCLPAARAGPGRARAGGGAGAGGRRTFHGRPDTLPETLSNARRFGAGSPEGSGGASASMAAAPPWRRGRTGVGRGVGLRGRKREDARRVGAGSKRRPRAVEAARRGCARRAPALAPAAPALTPGAPQRGRSTRVLLWQLAAPLSAAFCPFRAGRRRMQGAREGRPRALMVSPDAHLVVLSFPLPAARVLWVSVGNG